VTDTPPTYLHVTLQLVRGKSELFASTMSEAVPALEKNGWRLLGALTPGIGRLGCVIDLWQIPSADAVDAALSELRRHPDFPRWHAAFAESVAEEHLQIMHPTSYSPVLS
jgi:hypothetical protein